MKEMEWSEETLPSLSTYCVQPDDQRLRIQIITSEKRQQPVEREQRGGVGDMGTIPKWSILAV